MLYVTLPNSYDLAWSADNDGRLEEGAILSLDIPW